MNRTSRLVATAAFVLALVVPSAPADEFSPKLLKFRALDRIATGKVARYDLKEESTSFSYRIQAQYIEARVEKLRDGKWVRLGRVRATPPRPLNFWPVFKDMGLGRHRIVARAHNGKGPERESSTAKTIRFKVVKHIAHQD